MIRPTKLLSAAVLVWGMGFTSLSAASTDELIFKSGQKLVGEIKGMERGILSFSTDEMGTVSVKWEKVVGITSPGRFQVETDAGLKFVGSLEAAEQGKAIIATDSGKVLVGLASVVTIRLFERRRIERFKGYLDVGFSLQRAQRLATFTLGTDVSYRTSKWDLAFSARSYFSRQENVESTTRNDVALKSQMNLSKRLLLLGIAQLQQNKELNLARRWTLGGGLGNRFVRTNSLVIMAGVGVIGIEERFVGGEASAMNLDAIVSTSLSAFRYTSPKLDFTVSLNIVPSLTDWGRVRIDLNERLSYEIFKDFFISLSGFYSVDSRPPVEGTRKHDYGVFSSVRWEFK